MVNRIIEIRKAFRKALEEEGAPGKWNHVTDQKGMFILLSLTGIKCLNYNYNRNNLIASV
jgi:aspartate/tyrosine/aromatic aminotransferase